MALLLLLVLLASIFIVVTVAILYMRGESNHAGRIFRRWGICAAAYVAILIVTAALTSDRRLHAAGTQCDDDWCISVDSVSRTPTGSGTLTYRLGVRVFSRAHRGLRSAKGAWARLTDERGRRFGLVFDSPAIPFDFALGPGETVATSLTFLVPQDARELYFNGGVEGIHYASLIIGNGDLLGKPRISFRVQ